MNKQKLFTLLAFAGASILAATINFTPVLIGQNLKFTFFDLYAPITGGLFGAIPGALTVLAVEIVNVLWRQTFSLSGFLHLFPVMFGAWYFGTDKKLINLVPVIAILGFLINPSGREVWYFSLFWLIPILFQPFKQKSLLARSLGAAFTTHAVGGLLWTYAFNPPAAVWQSLVPIVITERIIFTLTAVIIYQVVAEIPGWIRSFVKIRIS